jgi:hypothetical protein
MGAGSRILATVLAGIVWIFAGFSVASGTQASKAITPAVLDTTAHARPIDGP